jgi:hypothetical protein
MHQFDRSWTAAWPKGRERQAEAILPALRDRKGTVMPDKLTQQFSRTHCETIEELLQPLVTLGQARRLRGGNYTS